MVSTPPVKDRQSLERRVGLFSLQKVKMFFKREEPRADSYRAAPRRIIRETKSIEKLLIEILAVIAGFLPISSAALFIHSNRTVMPKSARRFLQLLANQVEPCHKYYALSVLHIRKSNSISWVFGAKIKKNFITFSGSMIETLQNNFTVITPKKIHTTEKPDPSQIAPIFINNRSYLFKKLQYIMKLHCLGLDIAAQLLRQSEIKQQGRCFLWMAQNTHVKYQPSILFDTTNSSSAPKTE